jgi:uncharacterized membrane protein
MKKHLITGLVILLPVALTILIVAFFFNLLTDPFVGAIKGLLNYLGILKSGFLFLTADEAQSLLGKLLVLVFLVGFTVLLGALTRWFFIRYVLKFWDYILHRIPIVSPIYKISQDVINTLLASDTNSFKQVVMVPFPHAKTYSIGFVTRDDMPALPTSDGKSMVAVFVPTAPNPTSGFLMSYDEKEILYLDMKIEEAFKCIVSCGVLLTPFKQLTREEAVALAEKSKETTAPVQTPPPQITP